MDIVIVNNGEIPIYKQISDSISLQIIQGELKSGTCLPPIRTVARELQVSVITVKSAWSELERGGYIVTVCGKGCFVADLHGGKLDSKRDIIINDILKKDIAYFRSLGLSDEEIAEAVRKCCAETASEEI